MELKYLFEEWDTADTKRSNRTFMELKSISSALSPASLKF